MTHPWTPERKATEQRIAMRNLEFVLTAKALLGNRCDRCKVQFDPAQLDWHHRDREHKRFNIGRTRKVSLRTLFDEIAKCDLLCDSCHGKVSAEERAA
jgi:hypothetical protein